MTFGLLRKRSRRLATRRSAAFALWPREKQPHNRSGQPFITHSRAIIVVSSSDVRDAIACAVPHAIGFADAAHALPCHAKKGPAPSLGLFRPFFTHHARSRLDVCKSTRCACVSRSIPASIARHDCLSGSFGWTLGPIVHFLMRGHKNLRGRFPIQVARCFWRRKGKRADRDALYCRSTFAS